MLDEWWTGVLNPGQTPGPLLPGDREASPQEKLFPSLLVQAQGICSGWSSPIPGRVILGGPGFPPCQVWTLRVR